MEQNCIEDLPATDAMPGNRDEEPHTILSDRQKSNLFARTFKQFRPLCPGDINWVAPLLASENSMATTGCFGTLYLWSNATGLLVAQMDGRLLTHYHYMGQSFFGFPMGSGPIEPAIGAMADIAGMLGEPLVIKGITPKQKALLETSMPKRFCYQTERIAYDYIYRLETLCSLPGKKLQKKRNHCNHFEKLYANWSFQGLRHEHFFDCAALLREWRSNHTSGGNLIQSGEEDAILRAFGKYDQLGLDGGVLFVGTKIVAFTIGEQTCQNTFDIHFEKADASLVGAYAMINREFSRNLREKYAELQFINREEDMGIWQLRRAKEVYYPEFLLEKYVATDSSL